MDFRFACIFLHLSLGSVADAYFLIPFPAAAVAEEHEDVFAFGGQSFGQFAVGDFYTTAHLFVGDIQTFEGFDEDIAQVMVKGFLYAEDFLFALFGEGAAEVFANEASPIPYYIIYNGTCDVAEQVQDVQGQLCQKSHEVVFLLFPVLVHVVLFRSDRAKVRIKSEK